MLKITNSVKSLALTASSVALGLGIVGATSAQASNTVFWDVEFFDELGEVVGDGGFSYDPTTTTFVATDPDFLSEVEGFEVQTALESVGFTLFGQEVGDFTDLTWWFESDFDPGQRFVDRSGEPSIRFNSWVFVDDDFRFATDVLFMDNPELISEALGVGDWSFEGSGSTGSDFISGAGQWTATLRSQTVPEPTATLSLFAFSALGVASVFKRKN